MSTKDNLKLKKVKRFLSHLNIATEAVLFVPLMGLARFEAPTAQRFVQTGPSLPASSTLWNAPNNTAREFVENVFVVRLTVYMVRRPGQTKVARVSCVKTKLEHG